MKKLKFYRLFCEKTQRELAKEVGCTQPLISMFENEKLYPGPILKDALSKALNLPKDEIFAVENNTLKLKDLSNEFK